MKRGSGKGGEFGLAGYFCSHVLGRIWRVAKAPECGIVGISTGLISDHLELKYLCRAGI